MHDTCIPSCWPQAATAGPGTETRDKPSSIEPQRDKDYSSVLATVGRLASLWSLVPDGMCFIAKGIPSIIFVIASVGKFLEAALALRRRSAVDQWQPGCRGRKHLFARNFLHGRAAFACGDDRYGGVPGGTHDSQSLSVPAKEIRDAGGEKPIRVAEMTFNRSVAYVTNRPSLRLVCDMIHTSDGLQRKRVG